MDLLLELKAYKQNLYVQIEFLIQLMWKQQVLEFINT
jgi:hypothetical protein